MRTTTRITKSKAATLALGGALLLPGAPVSADVAVPNEFQAGNTAKAEEVNANFTALKNALDDALALIDEQSARIDALEQETENLRAMNEHVSVVADAAQPSENRIVIEGVNLQLIDGAGETAQENGDTNGLGNLIIGYGGARNRQYADELCSDGDKDNESDCTSAGAHWAQDHRSGSHNVVIGYDNAYSANGGLVVGLENAITNEFAVSFGYRNTARGVRSTVLGGMNNTASYFDASVTGGENNTASGRGASVSGGQFNTASGGRASVSGGEDNEASISYASVTGGSDNTASGSHSVVTGGNGHSATGDHEISP